LPHGSQRLSPTPQTTPQRNEESVRELLLW
jgi:hypothetical protein